LINTFPAEQVQAAPARAHGKGLVRLCGGRATKARRGASVCPREQGERERASPFRQKEDIDIGIRTESLKWIRIYPFHGTLFIETVFPHEINYVILGLVSGNHHFTHFRTSKET